MSVTVVPYLRPSSEQVSLGDWTFNGAVVEGARIYSLTSWEPNTPIVGERTFRIDVDKVRADCLLPKEAEFTFGVMWHSPGTTLRGPAATQVIRSGAGGAEGLVRIEVPGMQLAGDVRLRTQLVLGNRNEGGNVLSPGRPGSILFEDIAVLRLEGAARMFPIEVVDFGATGHLPKAASWFLEWNPLNLHEPVHGGMRLLINASHAPVIQAVSSLNPRGDHDAISSFIRFEVARSLIRGALENEEFVRDEEMFAEGSIGCCLRRLVGSIFPGEPFEVIRERMRQSPEEFLAEIQDGFQLFQAP